MDLLDVTFGRCASSCREISGTTSSASSPRRSGRRWRTRKRSSDARSPPTSRPPDRTVRAPPAGPRGIGRSNTSSAPSCFRTYWLLLRVVLILMLAGHVMGGAILLANGAGWSQVGHLAERLVETSLIVIGWLTLLAAVGELWITKSRVLEKWNPRTLVLPPKKGIGGGSAPATTVSNSAFCIPFHCPSGAGRLVAPGVKVSDSPLCRWRRHRGVGACHEPHLPASRVFGCRGSVTAVRSVARFSP